MALPRLADDLVTRLRLQRQLSDLERPFVLVDDLTTGGGHIRACAGFSRAAAVNVVLAVCAAEAEPSSRKDPFARRVVEWPDVIASGPRPR
jgi:hypothetical protein